MVRYTVVPSILESKLNLLMQTLNFLFSQLVNTIHFNSQRISAAPVIWPNHFGRILSLLHIIQNIFAKKLTTLTPSPFISSTLERESSKISKILIGSFPDSNFMNLCLIEEEFVRNKEKVELCDNLSTIESIIISISFCEAGKLNI